MTAIAAPERILRAGIDLAGERRDVQSLTARRIWQTKRPPSGCLRAGSAVSRPTHMLLIAATVVLTWSLRAEEPVIDKARRAGTRPSGTALAERAEAGCRILKRSVAARRGSPLATMRRIPQGDRDRAPLADAEAPTGPPMTRLDPRAVSGMTHAEA